MVKKLMKLDSHKESEKWLALRFPSDGRAEADEVGARRLQVATLKWCERYFLGEIAQLETALSSLNTGLFSVLVYGGASREAAQFLSDFMAWWFLLDDRLECEQSGEGTGKRRRALFRSYVSAIKGNAVAGEIEDCFVLAARELGRRLPEFARAEFIKRLSDSMKGWLFKGIEEELALRHDPSKAGVESYFLIRPFSSGALPTLYLAELASAHITLEKARKPLIGELLESAGQVIYLGNDIFSYHKETRRGCSFNLAVILQKEKGMDEREALSECARYHNEAACRYMALKGELEGSAERRWIEGIDRALAGLIAWQNSVQRYGLEHSFWHWI